MNATAAAVTEKVTRSETKTAAAATAAGSARGPWRSKTGLIRSRLLTRIDMAGIGLATVDLTVG